MLGYSFDWDREVNTTDPELLQVDPVDLPADVQARPGLQGLHARQLVHQLQDRPGQRGSRGGRVRALRRRGHPQGEEPVDAGHHQVRRPADRRSGRRGLYRAGEDPAAQLDRPVRGYRGGLHRHQRRQADRLHHPLRYALRRDLHGHLPGAPLPAAVEGPDPELGRRGGLYGRGRPQVRL